MGFQEDQQIRYYQFDLLKEANITQGIFTRQGGVSPEPWSSLNLGGTNGDDRTHVIENRKRIFQALNRPVASLYDAWQVHGHEVIFVEKARPLDSPHVPGDIILTDKPDVTLFMRFADCVPIALVDPVRQVVGLAHAGWQGTVQQVGRVAVDAMRAHYGCQPGDILAGIGPSISVERYEVGAEVVDRVRQAFGVDASGLLKQHHGRVHFDLWAANRLTLENCGVRQIQVAGLCTASNTKDWYSHRGEKGKTGRFGALLALAS